MAMSDLDYYRTFSKLLFDMDCTEMNVNTCLYSIPYAHQGRERDL